MRSDFGGGGSSSSPLFSKTRPQKQIHYSGSVVPTVIGVEYFVPS